jgi:transcriptional regulator with XRE-family HTH domain
VEEAQKLDIAKRIRLLRERSPLGQREIAERLGITLRAYQKVEARGTTKMERCEELAEIHDVTAAWIWSGKKRLPAPDVLSDLGDDSDQLDRIEDKLDFLTAAEVRRHARSGASREAAARAAEKAVGLPLPAPRRRRGRAND